MSAPRPRLPDDDLAQLRSHRLLLDQLIARCIKEGPIYQSDPKSTADINRTAKRLRGALDVALRRLAPQPGG